MNKKFLKTSFYTISFFASLSAWSSQMNEEEKPKNYSNYTSIDYASNALSRSTLTCNKEEEEKTHNPSFQNNANTNDEKCKYSKSELIKYIQFLEEEVDKSREREAKHQTSFQELQNENKFLIKRTERIEIINDRLKKTNTSLIYQLQNTNTSKPFGH